MVNFIHSENIPQDAQQNMWNFVRVYITRTLGFTVRGQLDTSSGKGFMHIQKNSHGWWAHIAFESEKEAYRFYTEINNSHVTYDFNGINYELTLKIKRYISRQNRKNRKNTK